MDSTGGPHLTPRAFSQVRVELQLSSTVVESVETGRVSYFLQRFKGQGFAADVPPPASGSI